MTERGTYADGFNVAVKAAAKVLRALAEGNQRELHTVNEAWQQSVDEIICGRGPLVEDLAMLVKRLSQPNVSEATKGAARDFLRLHGLLGDPLREEGPSDV